MGKASIRYRIRSLLPRERELKKHIDLAAEGVRGTRLAGFLMRDPKRVISTLKEHPKGEQALRNIILEYGSPHVEPFYMLPSERDISPPPMKLVWPPRSMLDVFNKIMEHAINERDDWVIDRVKEAASMSPGLYYSILPEHRRAILEISSKEGDAHRSFVELAKELQKRY
jgi:hypothetical protein